MSYSGNARALMLADSAGSDNAATRATACHVGYRYGLPKVSYLDRSGRFTTTLRGVMNAHVEPAYCREPWKCAHGRTGDCDCLHESERAQERCIILPLYHQMTEREQTKVVSTLQSVASDDGTKRDCVDNVLASKAATGT